MTTQSFRAAGWIAVLAILAFVAEIIVTLALELPNYAELIPPFSAPLLLAVHITLASYAMYRLRALLNEKYEYHGADSLISILIGVGILFALILIGTRQYANNTVTLVAMLGVGLPLSAVSMLFGYRLLGVDYAIGGYRKPFAFAHIFAPICFLTVVLAPAGLLLLVAAQILLALMFFNDEEIELEFV